MVYRGDACRRASADRIGQPQQIDQQRRFAAKDLVEAGFVGFFGDQFDQVQQALRRGIQLAPFDNRRFGEVVSLELMESQKPA